MEDGQRVPLSGVDVRLLSPGASWDDGILLIEKETSGFYECFIDEEDCGYYEVWDNLSDPDGAFSGKTCIIGKVDARGLQNECIYGNHILDGVVTANKIANNAISLNHLSSEFILSLSRFLYELQDQDDGIGDVTMSSPASCTEDKYITHKLNREFSAVPYIIMTNQCNCFMYVSDISLDGSKVTIKIAIGNNYEADYAKYQLLAIPF
jgi:hypothetical protein